MTAHLIDGRAVAKRLNDEVPAELDGPCGLATVLVLHRLPPHIDEAVAPAGPGRHAGARWDRARHRTSG